MSIEEEPIFSFHGKELVFLLVKWWQMARIGEVLADIRESNGGEPYGEYGGDPLDSEEALNKLMQSMADDLMEFKTRENGTVIVDNPFYFNFDKNPPDGAYQPRQ